MTLRTLEGTALESITAAFNAAFGDYLIPLQFTPEGMAAKIKSEAIDLRYSIGAFDGESLVGFILHGHDLVEGLAIAYNAGTGVLPAYRGQGLTSRMYRFAIPLLKEAGIFHHVLEVIDKNDPARKVYEAIGFRTVRKLTVFNGTPVHSPTSPVDIRAIDAVPSGPAFAGMTPAWQNSTASVNRDRAAHQILGAFTGEKLVGYAVFVPATGRVKQFAVHAAHRRQGIGSALFLYMRQSSGSLLVTHIDAACTPVTAFLAGLQLQELLHLYEMKLEVSNGTVHYDE